MRPKACESCGRTFLSRFARARFCSDRCRAVFHKGEREQKLERLLAASEQLEAAVEESRR